MLAKFFRVINMEHRKMKDENISQQLVLSAVEYAKNNNVTNIFALLQHRCLKEILR